MLNKISEVSIVIAGEAGQGVQSIEATLVNIIKHSGYNVFATKEYMSRVRGGINSTQIRVSEKRRASYVEKTDIFIPLEKQAIARLSDRIQKDTLIIGEAEKLGDERVINVDFTKIATKLGNAIYQSMAAAGCACGIIGAGLEKAPAYIGKMFSPKGDDAIKSNIDAFIAGYDEGRKIATAKKYRPGLKSKLAVENELLLSGADAVAIGAIAGGCDSVFAYPMTPATGVFTALAAYQHRAGLVVEQAEDETGVINMALGAWYAGGRALVSTSGGGFALMTEGISLSGITETPVVVHLAQRPGPATGLPTRTEQGDLNLALYAGHGVFPRIIFAPGNTRQGFELAARAFDWADKFQAPVFILTDQYFVDTYYNVPMFPINAEPPEKYIVATTENYKRYALAKDGFSPRGVPGFGTGTVCSDSDEHDESGRITEDLRGISLAMKNKRMKKFAAIRKAALAPELYGPRKYKYLIVAWGSTLNSALEALELSELEETALLHFSQVYPLHRDAGKYLKKAEKTVALENSQTAQFASLLMAETGIAIKDTILRYDGFPFAADALAVELKNIFT
ncbi:MAG: 2-oxoacid:acceptor oxidoreductase subunit alpha [Syntrophales bacterium]|jgi:2-oxoglutarate ferredoxin oxidoreductase subunit alpha|nr:2-oxoacid:acceptor oxidoreductase subunit alpha [Syntrophales bacterium]